MPHGIEKRVDARPDPYENIRIFLPIVCGVQH